VLIVVAKDEEESFHCGTASQGILIIRRLGSPQGGKLIAFPPTLRQLFEEGRRVLGIEPSTARIMPEEAEITTMDIVPNRSVVVLLTKEEEEAGRHK